MNSPMAVQSPGKERSKAHSESTTNIDCDYDGDSMRSCISILQDIDKEDVREMELKKREETLVRKEADLNKWEIEIQEGIHHVATLKSFVGQLEKKVQAIQEENCLLRVQIHDLTQTTAGEDKSMAADTGAAIIPQLMASVASLTSCVSSINLRLDKIKATLQGEQPRKKRIRTIHNLCHQLSRLTMLSVLSISDWVELIHLEVTSGKP